MTLAVSHRECGYICAFFDVSPYPGTLAPPIAYEQPVQAEMVMDQWTTGQMGHQCWMGQRVLTRYQLNF